MTRNVVAVGDRALFVELGEASTRELHAAAAHVRVQADVVACVVGQSSLLALFRDAPDPSVFAFDGTASATLSSHRRELAVSFAPEQALDLAEFLEHAALTRDDFLRRIDGLTLTVRYLGFRGGFGYLDGWPAEWSMPRRPTSRPLVPRGSFGIAGAMAGFYPLDSPGGWNLLGRTAAALAYRLAPGDELVLRPTLEPLGAIEAGPEVLAPTLAGIEFLRSAQLTTIVGAPDHHGLDHGIAEGGAFDPLSAMLANRAVGNDDCAPLLECALIGPRIRFTREAVVAWYGATCSIPPALPLRIRAGDDLALGPLRDGARGWLAIGLGGGEAKRWEHGDHRTIHTMAGPHDVGLKRVECEVTPQLDRVGIRLRPLQPLGIAAPAELRSIGMLFGSVQLHPDGSLVAMGPEHPVTGGYLQPMTVPTFERWKLAQLRPGERITFVVER